MTISRTPLLDRLTADLTFEEKLQLERELHIASLHFSKGDKVAASHRLRGSYTDEDLEDEGEDALVRYDVPRGTEGRVTKVREYVCPYPYAVLFDNGTEISVRQDDLARVS
ncbi:hypothetical protein [Streptomyces sp. NPDC056670]|uniref:hypothetical protein n=1 Tax=Streptomyces sp. NPDC056670 TaxID=3345904 RepID=UPI003688B453